MADVAHLVPLTLTLPREQLFPVLTPAQIARVAAHGQQRRVAAGEILAEAAGP